MTFTSEIKRPEFISGDDFRSYLTLGKLGKLFNIDHMKANSWVMKKIREGRDFSSILHDGSKKYKVSHVIAKARGCGCSINPPRVSLYKAESLEKYIDELEVKASVLEQNIKTLNEQYKSAELFAHAKYMVSQPIANEKEIVSAASVDVPTAGVYFLIRNKRIVYVGQSVSVLGRIGNHALEGVKEFDSYAFIECEKENLNILESIYIHILAPEYNGNAIGGSKLAPVGKGEMYSLLSSLSAMRNKTTENIEQWARDKADQHMRRYCNG